MKLILVLISRLNRLTLSPTYLVTTESCLTLVRVLVLLFCPQDLLSHGSTDAAGLPDHYFHFQ